MARVITIPIGPIYMGRPCRGIVHVVEQGDTLYNLGKRYHVSVAQIMFANPYVDVYNLQIGAELCIPVGIQPRERETQEEQDNRMGGMPSREELDDRMGGMPPQMEVNPQTGGMPNQMRNMEIQRGEEEEQEI